jgi:coenzyme PQQ synthesis protein D (PqqD)
MGGAVTIGSTVKAAREQVSAGLGDEAVILGLDRGEYYGLNDAGTRIWNLIQEPRRVSDVRDTLVREFDIDPERCEREVIRLLSDMASEGLVDVDP